MCMPKNLRNDKVAFSLSSFRAGGGEKTMIDLANWFSKEGYSVDLLVLSPKGELADMVNPGVRVITLNTWRIIFALPKFIQYLRHNRPALIVATDEHTHLLCLMARFISGSRTRVALRMGNMFSELYGRYSGIKRHFTYFLMRRLYRYADVVIANSQGVADDIVSIASLDLKKVSVIYNPKPLTDIRSKAEQQTGCVWLDEKTLPVVVGVGRLREQKNFSMLIRAFGNVLKKKPARLLIVGSGREEERLRSLIEELGLESSVLLVGYSDNPYAFMAKADVFAFSSLWEGMPNALMEAMVCGIPVVANDCPSGPRELLAPNSDHTKRLTGGSEDAPFGILVALGDEDAFSESIVRMLEDNELRETYSRASVMRAEAFDTDSIMRQYEAAFRIKN